MKRHWKLLQRHHIYLGLGSLVALTALVVALTFGLSSAQAQVGDPIDTVCKENQIFYPDAKACMTLKGYQEWKCQKKSGYIWAKKTEVCKKA